MYYIKSTVNSQSYRKQQTAVDMEGYSDWLEWDKKAGWTKVEVMSEWLDSKIFDYYCSFENDIIVLCFLIYPKEPTSIW